MMTETKLRFVINEEMWEVKDIEGFTKMLKADEKNLNSLKEKVEIVTEIYEAFKELTEKEYIRVVSGEKEEAYRELDRDIALNRHFLKFLESI